MGDFSKGSLGYSGPTAISPEAGGVEVAGAIKRDSWVGSLKVLLSRQWAWRDGWMCGGWMHR